MTRMEIWKVFGVYYITRLDLTKYKTTLYFASPKESFNGLLTKIVNQCLTIIVRFLTNIVNLCLTNVINLCLTNIVNLCLTNVVNLCLTPIVKLCLTTIVKFVKHNFTHRPFDVRVLLMWVVPIQDNISLNYNLLFQGKTLWFQPRRLSWV